MPSGALCLAAKKSCRRASFVSFGKAKRASITVVQAGSSSSCCQGSSSTLIMACSSILRMIRIRCTCRLCLHSWITITNGKLFLIRVYFYLTLADSRRILSRYKNVTNSNCFRSCTAPRAPQYAGDQNRAQFIIGSYTRAKCILNLDILSDAPL